MSRTPKDRRGEKAKANAIFSAAAADQSSSWASWKISRWGQEAYDHDRIYSRAGAACNI